MAIDIFAKIGDIKGESNDSKHRNAIEVLSFSWGISNASRQHAPGRVSPARKVNLQSFSIMKRLDSTSPQLFVSACDGSVFPEVNFTLRKAGGEQMDYFKIALRDVVISSVAPSGSSGGGDPMEQVSFDFASAEISAADANGVFRSSSTCGGSLEEELPPVIIENVKKE